MTKKYPTLETDSIREAVFEVRFDHEPDFVPEIFYGRMSDFEEWHNYKPVRLPISDIPDAVRRSDPNLQHKPIIELVSPDGKNAIRLGPNVLILSRRGDYQGWDGGFGADIEKLCDRLLKVVGSLRVTRLGLRYINALRSDIHGIRGPENLQIELNVANATVDGAFSLGFVTGTGSQFETMNRLSTVEFASGAIPDNTTFIIDLDVRTNGDPKINDLEGIMNWAKIARSEKNERFFSVLGEENIERLRKRK